MAIFSAGVGYYLSSSVNPLLYSVMSKRFRRGFRDMFRGGNGSNLSGLQMQGQLKQRRNGDALAAVAVALNDMDDSSASYRRRFAERRRPIATYTLQPLPEPVLAVRASTSSDPNAEANEGHDAGLANGTEKEVLEMKP